LILSADTREGIIMTIRRVLQSIADARTSLDCAVVRCPHARGQACLNGFAAYSLALYGLLPDSPQKNKISPDQRVDTAPKNDCGNVASFRDTARPTKSGDARKIVTLNSDRRSRTSEKGSRYRGDPNA